MDMGFSSRSESPLGAFGAPACPICGNAHASARGMVRDYRIFSCPACHALFVSPFPTDEQLSAFYSGVYFSGGQKGGGYMDYDADKRATLPTLNIFLDRLETFVPKGKLLDVGAATGFFLEQAQSRGWEVSGNEFSSDAAEKAKQRGIPMTVGELHPEHYPLASFDAVTMLDVIEHVRDPRRTIRDVVSLTRPGGCILLNTPDVGSLYARILGLRWHAVTPPEHLVLFSEKTLRRLLEDTGLEVLWAGKVPKQFRLSYIAHTLGTWTGFKPFVSFASFLERRSSLNWSIPLNLRDNITVIARRPV